MNRQNKVIGHFNRDFTGIAERKFSKDFRYCAKKFFWGGGFVLFRNVLSLVAVFSRASVSYGLCLRPLGNGSTFKVYIQ